MEAFLYTGLPARVVFGAGSLQHLERELDLLAAKRVLVICTPGHKRRGDELALRLGSRCVGVHDRAVMHTPVETVTSGVTAAQAAGSDCLLAIGGGSSLGLAKGIALHTGLPILAVPTTYSGSEMTPLQGITEGGIKRSHKHLRMLPKSVIYDPALTVSLPVAFSVTSGMNGMAHACEGLYAQDANPLMTLIAEQGIRGLAGGLPRVVADPADLDARSDCLFGAFCCGTVIGSVGMALHHKLAHVLGGSFGLPHAETHAILLPHTLAYNAAAAPDAMRRIARCLEAPSGPTGVYDLLARLNAPLALQAIGMREADLERAAELATESPYWNPRLVDREPVLRLLRNALRGVRPE